MSGPRAQVVVGRCSGAVGRCSGAVGRCSGAVGRVWALERLQKESP